MRYDSRRLYPSAAPADLPFALLFFPSSFFASDWPIPRLVQCHRFGPIDGRQGLPAGRQRLALVRSSLSSTIPPNWLLTPHLDLCSVPLGMATTMGLSAVVLKYDPEYPGYPTGLTSAQVGAGLPAAAAAQTLLKESGAAMLLVLLFMAVTSAASAGPYWPSAPRPFLVSPQLTPFPPRDLQSSAPSRPSFHTTSGSHTSVRTPRSARCSSSTAAPSSPGGSSRASSGSPSTTPASPWAISMK